MEFLKKISFLFLLSYFTLYLFPFPVNHLPIIIEYLEGYYDLQNQLVMWFGKNVLTISDLNVTKNNSSGDATFDYVKLVALMVISFFISLGLFFLVKNPKTENKLYEILIIYCRYCLGFYLINYGIFKFYSGQFSPLDLIKLDSTIGNSSPMGLMVSFMAYSKTYLIFTGICEIIVGGLLFFRGTLVIGILLSTVIMLNIVMLNYCYDFPVKLFSTHLFIISLIIFSKYYQSIFPSISSYFGNQQPESFLDSNKSWVRISKLILKVIFIVLITRSFFLAELLEDRAIEKPKHHLSAVYKTKSFNIRNDSTSLAFDENIFWDRMIIENTVVKIVMYSDSAVFFHSKIDTVKKSINLFEWNTNKEIASLKYLENPENLISINGVYKKNKINVVLKKKLKNEFELFRRGFHWINETPYNL